MQAGLLQVGDGGQHLVVAEHDEDFSLVDEPDGEAEDGALSRSRHASDGR
jgi:hypothetical protein